jgi:oligopeptide/dipeptide ABC transporter ATP-binding protein
VSALDVSIQAQILNLLRELQERFDLTYLFIAHDLAVVKHISDRIAVMYLGEIVEEADTDEIFARPLHPYTQALLSSIPIPVPRGKRERVRLEGDVPTPIDPPAGCRFHTRCPIAIDECRSAKPPLIEISPGHRVACIRTDVSEQFAPKLESVKR